MLYIVIALFSFVARVTSEIARDKWSCGVTAGLAESSYNLFTGKCKEYMPHVNFCCASHKDCYKLQLEEQHCNNQLCMCLMGVITEEAKKEGCGYPIYRGCTDARMHGEELYRIYNASGPTEGCGVASNIDDACQVNYAECLKKQKPDECEKYRNSCQKCATKQCNYKLEQDKKKQKTKTGVSITWHPVALLIFYSVHYLRLI